MSDAPKSPEPNEPDVDAADGPEAAVEPVEPVEPTPEPPHPTIAHMDVDPDAGERLETELSSDAVTVRRAPRYPAFIGLGVVLGAIVALALTFLYPANGEFDRGQVFGFLLLWCGAFGAALGGVVALLVDRSLARRAGSAVAEHESTHYVDDDPAS
ncbi:hypothetical protein ACFPER_03300 [Agromyces aurantiacus]|uniref:AtpZ/AtpI family protein n=1 Tax=Agromyces aurantiacus TaxID=165814 RepID=A0ABV9R1T8_9MICO|nr:hypothetical protein [Agromyces aurantiacus]MBM7506119.1 hypothetical protein [Agromyces aurantiacus]